MHHWFISSGTRENS